MEEILHHSLNNGTIIILGGAGFCPSTAVSESCNHTRVKKHVCKIVIANLARSTHAHTRIMEINNFHARMQQNGYLHEFQMSWAAAWFSSLHEDSHEECFRTRKREPVTYQDILYIYIHTFIH